MSSSTNEEKLAPAILQNVENNVYPDSDDITSASLPPSAISSLLAGLSRAQEDVKNEIRTLGRGAAPDIDGWIKQAKQIQADIERSKATARDIVKEAEAAKGLRTRVQDAASKVSLLENELVFNESLSKTIKHVKVVTGTLKQAKDAAEQYKVQDALRGLQEADTALGQLGSLENTRAYGILQKQVDQLRSGIIEILNDCWKELIVVDPSQKFMTIKKEISRQNTITIDDVVEAMTSLELIDNAIDILSKDLDSIVFAPRLSHDATHQPYTISIHDNNIIVSEKKPNPTVSNTLADVSLIVEYLNARFPTTISLPLSGKLLPLITARLVSGWLESSIPVSLQDISTFQGTVAHLQGLIERLQALEWAGVEPLVAWVDNIPSLWLAKRKEVALASIRKLCKNGVTSKRSVERVETQMVSNQDAIVAPATQQDDDDWGAEWGEDDNKDEAAESTPSSAVEQPKEDEDASAWGWNEENGEEEKKGDLKPETDKEDGVENDEAEAWGWGDEDENEAKPSSNPLPTSPAKPKKVPQTNGQQPQNPSGERELTLRETYTVTAIPDAIIDTIVQFVADVEQLHAPNFSDSTIAPAAVALYTLPSLILAMFRAVAASFYSADAGNMLIYNDCTRLADRLKMFLSDQATKDQTSTLPRAARPSTQLQLDNEIKAIEGFGKRAYGREMESQRTIIRDLLDGAQGFSNCTVQPYKSECDSALTITVDRIRQVNKQWAEVLSHSARLQSLGSIVSTVTSKMIMDIEDMSDISEEESQRLRHYCQEIAKVGDVFQQQGSRTEGQGDLTGIYTPNWLKFQYLSEILDSSLADIKFLWSDSELKFEFEADEVIDLIKALFSESDHRRRAIAEIRNSVR